MNILRTLGILFIYEIGQVPNEVLSVIDIIIRRVRGSQVFLGGLLILITIYQMHLKLVRGRPFILSYHVITCFKMVKLDTSV